MQNENQTLPEPFFVLKFYNESISFATLSDAYRFMNCEDVGFGEIHEMTDGILKNIHAEDKND
ncbi:MAG: hypothetical protein C4294_18540 [Nitrospiraceae bacterium]